MPLLGRELELEGGQHHIVTKRPALGGAQHRDEPTDERQPTHPGGEDLLAGQDAGLGERLPERGEGDGAVANGSEPEKLRGLGELDEVVRIQLEVGGELVEVGAVARRRGEVLEQPREVGDGDVG